MFLILLLKLFTQFPFVSFLSISILSLFPFSILSVLPLHHPFFLFWSILCPPKIKTSIYYILFTNGTYFCILFHTMTYLFFYNAFYKLEKTKLLCLSSNLSYPEDLKKWHIFLHTVSHHDISFFFIMHSISLKKPNFYAWAPTCHTLRTWRNNGSLSQSSLFSLSSFPLTSLPSLLALLINSLSS